jgi:hypothetical protein
MAQQLSVSIYGVNGSATGAMGRIMSFPTQGIRMYPASATPTFSALTMATVIEVLPTGLNQPSNRYYSTTAIATLVTAANA